MLALLHQPPTAQPDASASLLALPPMLSIPPSSASTSAASTPTSTPKVTNRPFQCQEPGCGRRFNRKFTLSEHMKTHTGEKPYTCPVATCGKRFSTSGNLARHKRLHASIKPFECTIEGCKRSFPNELKLQQHLKIHLGGKSHMCKTPGCGKSFSTAGNLTRHMKNHHHITPTSSACSSGASSPYASASPVSVAGVLDYAALSMASFLPGPGPTNVPLTSYASLSPFPPVSASASVSSPSPSPLHPSMTNLFYAFHGTSLEDAVGEALEDEQDQDVAPTQPTEHEHEPSLHLGYEDLQYLPSLQAPEHGLFDDVIRFQLTQGTTMHGLNGLKMNSIYEN